MNVPLSNLMSSQCISQCSQKNRECAVHKEELNRLWTTFHLWIPNATVCINICLSQWRVNLTLWTFFIFLNCFPKTWIWKEKQFYQNYIIVQLPGKQCLSSYGCSFESNILHKKIYMILAEPIFFFFVIKKHHN